MTEKIVNDIATKNNIAIINYPFKELKACSIERDNGYYRVFRQVTEDLIRTFEENIRRCGFYTHWKVYFK